MDNRQRIKNRKIKEKNQPRIGTNLINEKRHKERRENQNTSAQVVSALI